MQIAILGLGKIGRIVTEKLLADGHEVVLWNRAKDVLEQYRVEKAELIVNQKLRISHSIESLQESLIKPRVFCTILPAGDETETVSLDLFDLVESGDIVIDAGDSFFKDTDRRSKTFEAKGVKYIGIGIGGGVLGLENGFSLMVGGNKEGYEYIKSVLDSLSKPNGSHAYFGESGAGHFVKMVHDSVTSVMTQAIAEGFGILTKSEYQFNVNDITAVWQGGGMPAGHLLSIFSEQLLHDNTIFQSQGIIGVHEAIKWSVQQGREAHVPVDLVEKTMDFRSRSQFDKMVRETVAAKLIAAVEKAYTGEEVKNPDIKPQ